MSLRLTAEPNNGLEVRISPMDVRINPYPSVLFLAASAVTLAIGMRDPRADYLYEAVIFTLAVWWCLAERNTEMKFLPGIPLALILGWGFMQLTLGTTVYRYATVESSLRSAALAATGWVSFHTFRSRDLRTEFLGAFAWFGASIAIVSVLAYFTSTGKILWMFDAPYPDVWGPFLSRNNFAQFLELAFPVALWFGLREPKGNTLYIVLGAVMLAAGLASASRAGSVILALEAVAAVWLRRKSPLVRRMAPKLLLATILFAAMPGVGHLAGRLAELDPYQGRREIAASTLSMIASRPWSGFGLGTFSDVYPAYAAVDLGQSVEHAHNDWLEWAAEGGIPYAAVWFALALWCAGPAVRSVWGIGIVGCFLHGIVDYPFTRLGISVWAFVLLGILASRDLAASDLREVPHRAH
ncbi:MAG TPA: O-antigen ligase family protein [Bryobacteraceae bacterium]|jgi:O-antigen ligase|nr:O-antigen ligase family protein [Bryobacteraceae bacterium]